MLFLLAVLAFLQMTIIPGTLILVYTGIRAGSTLRRMLYVFSLSLLFNYLTVFALTATGIYKPLTIYIIILLEIILLFLYIRKQSAARNFKNIIQIDVKKYAYSIKNFFQSTSLFHKVLFLLSLVVIGLFFYFWLSRIKEVFFLNDSVLAWNRFALDWYNNRLPIGTWRYPQLISTNWSLAYIIMRNPDIQFIAKSIMIFFPVGIAVIFLDLGLRKKQGVYFLGLILYGIILNYLYDPAFIAGGYADIAVSFFAFLAFYILYFPDSSDPIPITSFSLERCLISIVFASASAVSKQIGLYILFYILIWNFFLFYRNRGSLTKKEIIRTAVMVFLLVSLLVGTWYVYKEIRIAAGLEASELGMLTGIQHQGRSYGARFAYGFNRIIHARGLDYVEYFIYALMFLIIVGIAHKRIRYIILFIIFPFILMWGFLFSYDYRNLMLSLPFMALAAAYGLKVFIEKYFPQKISALGVRTGDWNWVPRPTPLPCVNVKLWILILLLLPMLLILNFTVFKEKVIVKNQRTQMRNVGDTTLNKKLYRYFEKNGFNGNVFSVYPYFRFLPVFRDHWAPERTDDRISYLIERLDRPNHVIKRQIIAKIDSGEYKKVFEHNQYLFLKISRLDEVNPKGQPNDNSQ